MSFFLHSLIMFGSSFFIFFCSFWSSSIFEENRLLTPVKLSIKMLKIFDDLNLYRLMESKGFLHLIIQIDFLPTLPPLHSVKRNLFGFLI